jgi:uncharacterized protein
VSVADIVGRPGKYRDVAIDADLPEVGNALTRVGEAPVRARLRCESVVEGVLVTGRVEGTTTVSCGRCLEERNRSLAVDVCELFVSPGGDADEDAYRLVGLAMDLRPLLTDAVALALPLRPLCREDCKGLCADCGRNLNRGSCDCARDGIDPRWAPLAALREQLEAN